MQALHARSVAHQAFTYEWVIVLWLFHWLNSFLDHTSRITKFCGWFCFAPQSHSSTGTRLRPTSSGSLSLVVNQSSIYSFHTSLNKPNQTNAPHAKQTYNAPKMVSSNVKYTWVVVNGMNHQKKTNKHIRSFTYSSSPPPWSFSCPIIPTISLIQTLMLFLWLWGVDYCGLEKHGLMKLTLRLKLSQPHWLSQDSQIRYLTSFFLSIAAQWISPLRSGVCTRASVTTRLSVEAKQRMWGTLRSWAMKRKNSHTMPSLVT